MSKAKPAVFLDRDGVINKDNGYVSEIDDFEFIEGVIEACLTLKEKGYLIVVITNQSGIARGLFSEEQFHTLTEWMDWSMADRGVDLDGIYYCPHYYEEGQGEFEIDCDCRKPKAGMLVNAIEDLNIDVEASLLVGDKISDLQSGIAAGVKNNYLVRTGKTITEQGESLASGIFDDLASLVENI